MADKSKNTTTSSKQLIHLDIFLNKNKKMQLIWLVSIFLLNTLMAIVFTYANKSLVQEKLYNLIMPLRGLNICIQLVALSTLIINKKRIAYVSILLNVTISLFIAFVFPPNNDLVALVSMSVSLILMQLILGILFEKSWNTVFLTILSLIFLNLFYWMIPFHFNITSSEDHILVFSILITMNYLLIMIGLFNTSITIGINRLVNFIKTLVYLDLKTGLYNEYQFEYTLSKLIEKHEKVLILAIDFTNLQYLNHHFGYRTVHPSYIKKINEIQSLMMPFGITYKLEGPVLAYIIPSDQSLFINSETLLYEIIHKIEHSNLTGPNSIQFNYQWLATQYPHDGATASQLMDNLYHLKYTKSPTLDSIRWYDHKAFEQMKRQLTLEKDLKIAIENNEITVVFQPQLTLKDYKIHGAEVLARWSHPEYGSISPIEFITMAESLELIDELTNNVIGLASEVYQKITSLNKKDPFQLAVNISAISINGNLESQFQFTPHSYEIEITESTLISLTGYAKDSLNVLKSKGFTVAIDDFGTGFSNLEYLHALDVDVLKIDKRFVDAMMNSDKALKLVDALIIMSHTLGFSVVAEGVETKMQCDVLATFDCDVIQGYWYAKPMVEDDFIEFYKNAMAL